jgi:hypothetical protein
MHCAFRRAAVIALAALAFTHSDQTSGQTPPGADETSESLPNFAGRDETFGYCIGCHSFRVVGRQGMDRTRWDATLDWMSEKHAMPKPDAELRKTLLDYLAQAYPPPPPSRPGGWTSPFAPKQ